MLKFLLTIMKFSLSSFGGGAVILSLIQKEFVDTGIISVSDYLLAFGLTQITPGPAAPVAVAFIGHKLFGIIGVLISCLGLFIPSFILGYILLKVIQKFKNNKFLDCIFIFLKPITVALILSVTVFLASITIIDNTSKIGLNLGAIIIGLLAFVGFGKFKFSTLSIVVVCGLLGLLVF